MQRPVIHWWYLVFEIDSGALDCVSINYKHKCSTTFSNAVWQLTPKKHHSVAYVDTLTMYTVVSRCIAVPNLYNYTGENRIPERAGYGASITGSNFELSIQLLVI